MTSIMIYTSGSRERSRRGVIQLFQNELMPNPEKITLHYNGVGAVKSKHKVEL